MRGYSKRTRHLVLSRHLERLERKIDEFEELDRRYFWVRLSVLLGGVLAIFIAYLYRQSSWMIYAGLAFLVILSVVVYFNRKVKHSILRFSLSQNYFASQLARMDLNWTEIPSPGTSSSEGEHPYASDLDIIGFNSIHQLLDTANSLGGSQRLKDWLLKPVPHLGEVLTRQATVKEICALSGFRSRLALNSSLVSVEDSQPWDGEGLVMWLERNVNAKPLKPLLAILGILALVNLTLFVLFAFNLIPAWWVISLVIYAAIYLFAFRNFRDAFGQAQYLSTTLERFRAVTLYLERYIYKKGSHLERICEPLCKSDRRPSTYLRRLTLIASAVSIGANPVVWLLLNIFMPWDVYFNYLLERYKARMQELLPQWLDVWYELEALNSLANFAYLNPDYTFPQIMKHENTNERVFHGESLGHPLIPDEVKVCNDFVLGKMGQVALITGSNMSGKSTFLRTIGVNLCLAFGGAPVNAVYLKTDLFRLYTCIQVTDSLADGISYFYAEVRRLKALLNALEVEHELPLFFLIDEIFRGTNNRERQIGGRAFVQTLVGGEGVGLISTHDLELVVFADELSNVNNYHFQEEVTQGRMLFDYCLRPGPSQTTNALQIMRMEGLPVVDKFPTEKE
jgi:ABC-type multidrug transport system fused ATPase/permease subunit